MSVTSLSHKRIVGWRWAREDRELQRHGHDVVFIHQCLHCSLFSIRKCVCQTARMAADVRPQDHTQIFILVPVWHLIKHYRHHALEQFWHSAENFSFLCERSPTSQPRLLTGDSCGPIWLAWTWEVCCNCSRARGFIILALCSLPCHFLRFSLLSGPIPQVSVLSITESVLSTDYSHR